jgi:hypothetical protein
VAIGENSRINFFSWVSQKGFPMQYAQFKHLTVSRLILGSNPFSGFSHQSPQMDWEMRHYFTGERIKAVFKEAEALGINTVIARADFHVMRLMLEYADAGGSLQWFAQTCPELGSHAVSIHNASAYGAKACHLHGGVMDNQYAQGRLEEVQPALDSIRQKGMLAGIAAHNPAVIAWAEEHLDVDYYLCCYYNPTPRDDRPEHVPGMREVYREEDRTAMTDLIPQLSHPVVHYKILAAGRNDPAQAFAFAASKMRLNDAVCVGVYPKDRPGMLKENASLLEESLARLQVA